MPIRFYESCSFNGYPRTSGWCSLQPTPLQPSKTSPIWQIRLWKCLPPPSPLCLLHVLMTLKSSSWANKYPDLLTLWLPCLVPTVLATAAPPGAPPRQHTTPGSTPYSGHPLAGTMPSLVMTSGSVGTPAAGDRKTPRPDARGDRRSRPTLKSPFLRK